MEPDQDQPDEPHRRATEYAGPVEVSTHVIGGRVIRLVRPEEPDRLLDDPSVHAWNRADDYMPYWAYLWPGAMMLGEALVEAVSENQARLSGPSTVLELGCGLGLCGLVALSLGLRVRFTDYDGAAFSFIRRSARENGFDPGHFSTRMLDWRDPPDERYPIIIGADLLYEHRLVPLVAGVLARMLAPDGLALIATPYRVSAEGFPAALEARGLACRADLISTRSQAGASQPGTVFRVARRVST